MKPVLQAKIATGVAALVVLLYVVTSLSYVAPSGGFTSATSGLRTVGSPYFSQSWNVFAPNILKSNIEMQISAQWRDDSGELFHSDWFSATQLEIDIVAGDLVPSRAIKQSWNLIRAYNTRFLELNDEQRDRVQDTFIQRSDDGFEPIPTDDLRSELNDMGDNSGDVASVLRYDDMLREYATYLATAYFGEDIERVRWRLWSQRDNSFEQRGSDVAEFEPTTRTFGWREAITDLDQDALDAYISIVGRAGGAL